MPRTETVKHTYYQFDELSDAAKEKAREWWRSCEAQDFDTEFVLDDAVQCAAILGITIDKKPTRRMDGTAGAGQPAIYWSGFSSQGDGACFEGSYEYAKGAAKAIRKHAPQDTELHRIADELQAIQRRRFYKATATMQHRGHYYHSGCMVVDVDLQDSGDSAHLVDAEERVTQTMRDFADWIYRQLEREYEYRMSDECVDESIRINEYEFTENGERA